MKWWQALLGNATITRLVLIGLLGLGIAGRVYWSDLRLMWSQWETSRCESNLRDELQALASCKADLKSIRETNPRIGPELIESMERAHSVEAAQSVEELNQWLNSRF